MTAEEIDARAKELFKECGGLDMEWEAVDEVVRLHYRKMAVRMREDLEDAEPWRALLR